ncbi:hypothetical protein [Sphingomonas sp.]|uniref:hypothetical protein n=1 Tax=Sphingomonas sp. TaxID=28214 RepID=UPI003D6D07C1
MNERYYAPFDRTYADVTKRIEDEAEKLSGANAAWLHRLVVTFKRERTLWNSRPELAGYRLRWLLFRSKALRLVAGAFLHIGYDLPRAIADDWPGTGVWHGGPDVPEGRKIYFRLSSIFPESLVRSSRDPRTIGISAIFLRLASRRALTAAGIWVDHLRQGAWIHAEILSAASDRSSREAAMAVAMTAALEDASLLPPWSIFHLRPPHDAFFSPAWAAVAAALPPLVDQFGDALSLVIMVSLVTWQLIHGRLQLNSIADFIYAWGYLLNDYLTMAVREPDGFDGYRQRRQAELGIVPGLGASTA